MQEFRDLNYPTVPEQIHDTTGGESDIQGTIDKFFDDVVSFVGFNLRARQNFVEVRPQILHNYDNKGMMNPTDDRITSLLMSEHLVASALERRTINNMVEVYFSLYLNDQKLADLRSDPDMLVQDKTV